MSQQVDERNQQDTAGNPGPHSTAITAEGTSRDAVRRIFRKWKFWILLGAVTVVVLTTILMIRSGGSDQGILSPGNPAPDGAMAAAEILRQQGVDVKATDTLQETLNAVKAAGAANTTLLVHDRLGLLQDAQLDKLSEASARTVLVEPSVTVLSAFAPDIHAAGVVPSGEGAGNDAGTIKPQCQLNHPHAAGAVDRDGRTYRGPVMCYLIQNEQGGPSALYVQSHDGDVTVIGNGRILSNERLRFHGNAALTLRTLGAEPNLVWYQPSLADMAIEQDAPELGELVPDWVHLAGIWLVIVALMGVVWRSRRPGPLVVEPLPVVARAAETAEGRARLYQDARAVQRAAGNLRAGALSRLAAHFRLGTGVAAEAVARSVANQSSLPEHDVGRILVRSQPSTDAELLEWAQELDRLEKEVTAK
ncbi:MAG TPA: DUF4350 domain-containing protein [Arthrobacter sp.]|nr:DUF4350 domain-containing protein [Arthrobacter sp.]